ncbi:hypothetical protein CRG98_009797 [Punica granatum]|uniref:Uncharacterized protein n=1 Tax=Punica granatum TaxID=22663 RepID=A0A2I0KN58_PUNGR|nr:hypothetical protein CRG98_009797 [Punica granatum]
MSAYALCSEPPELRKLRTSGCSNRLRFSGGGVRDPKPNAIESFEPVQQGVNVAFGLDTDEEHCIPSPGALQLLAAKGKKN